MINKNTAAHLAIIAANVIYAANYTIAKTVMPSFIQPFGFIFIRVLGAVIFFWAIHMFAKKENIAKEDFPRLILCGLFGVAINQLFFFKGLNLSTPVNASLMMVNTPILVAVISILAHKESFSWFKILGIVLGASGALLLILGKEFSLSSSTFLGDFFVFLNAVSYGIYLTLVKPLMQKYHALTIIKWVFLFGFIPVFFVGFKEFQAIEWQTFTASTWWATAFVVIGVTCFAYLFNIFALSVVNPSVVGIYIYLQPLLAALIAVYFKADTFTFLKFVAAVCIFLGVYLVSFYPSKKIMRV